MYIIPIDEGMVLVCASFDHDFDQWAALFADRSLGRTAYLRWEATYPATAWLLQNGISGRYSGGALMNIPDPDHGERKWVVGTLVGNLTSAAPDDLIVGGWSKRTKTPSLPTP